VADAVVSPNTPDEEPAVGPAPGRDPGAVDESLPVRRLRHWLKAMFGGSKPAGEPSGPSDDR
jgi:hypothetical protein